ncbi:aminopeptidase P family N-terminal domain-containing protein [Clostridium sp. OS1-26]|uniref:aminopeptidase P family N-terminal domain-containing protein n=1 Tax=Clostridium sp. OS1-26 TaxID=3070681 RepID=UPI0027DFC149|nr:aminopeptidase P family N-terminal domain-containing protein [Clostridium sp. OS1-26]WML36362.1 aminopeptidase P family N-terminal domain-containing protein [Clostridium sp. OS1-26]
MNRELSLRIKCLQHEITKNKLDAYILTAQDSLLYFTGMAYKPEERAFYDRSCKRNTNIFVT